MTDSSDYISAMPTPLTISEDDAEILLNGGEPVPDQFAELAHALADLKAHGQPQPGDDYSALIAAAAIESRLTPMEQFADLQITITDDWTAQVVRRVGVGVAALFLLVAGTSGMAYAANGAKPGDLLYGLDRAAEAAGIGNGGAAERLEEVEALIASGEIPDGVAHAAEVIPTTPAAETAKAELTAAAGRLEGEEIAEQPQATEQVDDLLDYLHAAEDSEDGVDEQQVSALARQIGGPPDDDPGQSDEAPAQNKDDDEPGASGEAPGQNKDEDDDEPGASDEAPGQNKDEDDGDDEPDDTADTTGTTQAEEPDDDAVTPDTTGGTLGGDDDDGDDDDGDDDGDDGGDGGGDD